MDKKEKQSEKDQERDVRAKEKSLVLSSWWAKVVFLALNLLTDQISKDIPHNNVVSS